MYKIVHLSVSDGSGGAGIAAYRLHSLMNKSEKINSKFVALKSINTFDKSVYQVSKLNFFLARLGNFINNYLVRKKKKFGLFSFSLTGIGISKRKILKDADIIYLHWINNGFMSLNDLNDIFKLKKKVILFGHDMWYFTGGCHQSNNCDNYQLKCVECHFFDSRSMRKFIEKRRAHKYLIYSNHLPNLSFCFPSSLFREKAISSNIFPKSKIYCIPNILDTGKYKPSYSKNVQSKIRILYGAAGGPNNKYKGWDHFEYVINKLNSSFKENIEIDVFGYDFSENELSKIEFSFVSHGFIENENEMIKIYQSSDIFIFPSLQESFGQTLFEAMSCGNVPLSYDVGAASDLIDNKITGIVVPLGEKNQLLKGLIELLTNNTLDRMKLASQDKINNEFQFTHILDKHLELINS